ncbi:MAG: VWA domain-containing protein [bacterium]|nr:VWA domain-containing protein [bacterium]
MLKKEKKGLAIKILLSVTLFLLAIGVSAPFLNILHAEESMPLKGRLLSSPSRIAHGSSQRPSLRTIDLLSPADIIFSEDFEGGVGNWIVTNEVWEVGTPSSGPGSSYSGTNCAGTSLTGNYPDNSNSRLVSPTINLPSLSATSDKLTLSFYTWYEMESGYDYGYLQISTDGGSSWITLGASYNGSSNDWLQTQIDLSTYAENSIKIAFYFTSDRSVTYAGWYIDDILIQREYIPNVNVNLTQIDPSKFPTIECYAFVTDANYDPITELTVDNFQLTEQSVQETQPTPENISVASLSGQEEGVAIALVIDCSGSMSGTPLVDAKKAAHELVNKMQALDRMAVIPFSTTAWVEQSFTSDQSLLHTAIDKIEEISWTALYDGIYLGIEECVQEIGVKAVIALTDGKEEGPNNGISTHTLQEIIDYAKSNGTPVYTIGLGSANEDVLKQIAEETTGDINNYYYAPTSSKLHEIYNEIAQSIQSQYLITYYTHNPNYDGALRTVTVTVTYDGDSNSDSATYTVDEPPQIMLTQETIDLSLQSQYVGQDLTIAANITDNKQVTGAWLFYRTSGSGASYIQTAMTNVSGSLYEAIISSADVLTPGVDYYLVASDGTLTTSSPKNQPQVYPYQIAILPNIKPEIDHTPLTTSPLNTDITITATVADITDYIERVTLFYRTTGNVLYESIEMTNVSGDTYSGIIPASAVIEAGVEYYIVAWDNHGVCTYHGTDISPHQVVVTGNLLSLITQKEGMIDQLESIFHADPIVGIIPLPLTIGYDESAVKSLLNIWKNPSPSDSERALALQRLILAEQAIKDIFYRDPDIPGAKIMAKDTIQPVVDALLMLDSGMRVINKTNQYVHGIRWLGPFLGKITYRTANLLLMFVIDTTNAIISSVASDSYAGRVLEKSLDEVKRVMTVGVTTIKGDIIGEVVWPFGAFDLLGLYIYVRTQPHLDNAFNRTSNLEVKGSLSDAQSKVNSVIQDVSVDTQKLHAKLLETKAALKIASAIADITALAVLLPGANALTLLGQVIRVVSFGGYAIEAGRNGLYLFVGLPRKVEQAVNYSFDPSIAYPALKIMKTLDIGNISYHPQNLSLQKSLIASMSQDTKIYENLLQQVVNAVQNEDLSSLELLVPQLMEADEGMVSSFNNAWLPLLGVVNQAINNIPGFESAFKDSIDKPLTSNAERILLYGKLIEFLCNPTNSTLKGEISSQASIVKELNVSAQDSISNALSLASSVPSPPVIIVSNSYVPNELYSNNTYVIKATVKNVGPGTAGDIAVSLAITPPDIIDISSSPRVNIGNLSSGAEVTVNWTITTHQLSSDSNVTFTFSPEISNGFSASFSKISFCNKSSFPSYSGTSLKTYNYPNPFDPTKESTTIKYSIPGSGMVNVTINIYNIAGEKVWSYSDEKEAGYTYSLRWEGVNENNEKVASGVYIYVITAGSYKDSKKILVIK